MLRGQKKVVVVKLTYWRGNGVEVIPLGLEVGALLFRLEVQLHPGHHGVQRPKQETFLFAFF